MAKFPRIVNDNNYAEITIGNLTLYFSYETLIGFNHPQTGRIVRKNEWGVTTGKHLNRIDGGNKKNRLSSEEFAIAWRDRLPEMIALSV